VTDADPEKEIDAMGQPVRQRIRSADERWMSEKSSCLYLAGPLS